MPICRPPPPFPGPPALVCVLAGDKHALCLLENAIAGNATTEELTRKTGKGMHLQVHPSKGCVTPDQQPTDAPHMRRIVLQSILTAQQGQESFSDNNNSVTTTLLQCYNTCYIHLQPCPCLSLRLLSCVNPAAAHGPAACTMCVSNLHSMHSDHEFQAPV